MDTHTAGCNFVKIFVAPGVAILLPGLQPAVSDLERLIL